MTIDTERFKEYAYRGIDAAIEGAKKAASFVRDTGDGAIDRVDMLRLERRLERARAELGTVVFSLLEANETVTTANPDVVAAMSAVAGALETLERRKAAFASRSRASDDEKKKT